MGFQIDGIRSLLPRKALHRLPTTPYRKTVKIWIRTPPALPPQSFLQRKDYEEFIKYKKNVENVISYRFEVLSLTKRIADWFVLRSLRSKLLAV